MTNEFASESSTVGITCPISYLYPVMYSVFMHPSLSITLMYYTLHTVNSDTFRMLFKKYISITWFEQLNGVGCLYARKKDLETKKGSKKARKNMRRIGDREKHTIKPNAKRRGWNSVKKLTKNRKKWEALVTKRKKSRQMILRPHLNYGQILEEDYALYDDGWRVDP